MSHARLYRRLAVLVEGNLDIYRNKTAMSLLRFRPEDVVCVIDSAHAGRDMGDLCGVGQGVPIVASVAEALPLGIEWLVIGVATAGGVLPRTLRPELYDAIRARVGVISGLHESLNDPNLVSLAARHAVELVNLRKVPESMEHTVSTGKARRTEALRVLMVGTDANIGKTTVALSLHRHLVADGTRSHFVATGQDGVLITGKGLCVDRVIADFAGGAAEQLVLAAAKGTDAIVVEGVDSILSPCYGGAALSVLQGTCPDAMVLCHAPDRTTLRHTDVAMPPLKQIIDIHEAILRPLHPGKVVAVALNTLGLASDDAVAAVRAAERETGLPVVDVVREGTQGMAVLAKAVLGARPTRRQTRSR